MLGERELGIGSAFDFNDDLYRTGQVESQQLIRKSYMNCFNVHFIQIVVIS